MAGALAVAEPQAPRGVRVVLVRVAELGPPVNGMGGGAAGGWRSAAVAGLPRLEAPPGVGDEPGVVARRVPRVLVTEAQARDLVRSTSRLVFEVLDGRRPLRQLERVLSERALSAVRTMLRGGLRWPVRGATVHSVHLHQPSTRAIEASVVFHSERRHRALALRMDRNRHGWLATAIRIA